MDPMYQDMFITAATEHIQEIRQGIVQLQQSADNQTTKQLHIHAHSLKGEAFLMGYHQFGLYCLVLEKFFEHLSKSEQGFNIEHIVPLLEAIEELQKSLSLIKEQQKDQDMKEKIEELKQKLDVRE